MHRISVRFWTGIWSLEDIIQRLSRVLTIKCPRVYGSLQFFDDAVHVIFRFFWNIANVSWQRTRFLFSCDFQMQSVVQWPLSGFVQLTCTSWAVFTRGRGGPNTKHAWTWRFCVSLFQGFLKIRFIILSVILNAFSVLWTEHIQR